MFNDNDFNAPELPVHFDEDGRPCFVDMPTDEPEADDRADVRESLAGLIRLLTDGATALQAGQRVHLLAYAVGVNGHRTQQALADELNISKGRLSQIRREMPKELGGLLKLKARTAKRRAHC